jgi:4-hydroxy-2-oxoglutarate aldolase
MVAIGQKTAGLSGIFIPSVTPFDEDGAIDFVALERNQKHWSGSAVAGVMVLGSNGEWRSLSDDESLEVVRVAIAEKGDKAFVVGTGRDSVLLTLRFIDRLHAVPGIDALAILTPHYFADSMSDRALVAYYREVADESAFPVYLYVAPKFANGVTLSVEAVADLADHPNIHGIKESDSKRLVAHLSQGPRPDFSVMAGSVGSLLACLDAGGAGGVVSPANYLPNECARILALHLAGDRDQAVNELQLVLDIASRTAGSHGVAGVKACMTLRGLDGGFPRKPVLPVEPKEVEQMQSAFSEMGFV